MVTDMLDQFRHNIMRRMNLHPEIQSGSKYPNNALTLIYVQIASSIAAAILL